MNTAKAAAGGSAGALSDLVTYLVTTYVPGLTSLPPDQIQNLEIVMAASLVWLAVYLTPNAPKF